MTENTSSKIFPLYYIDDHSSPYKVEFLRKDGTFGDLSYEETRFFIDFSEALKESRKSKSFGIRVGSLSVDNSEKGRNINSPEEAFNAVFGMKS